MAHLDDFAISIVVDLDHSDYILYELKTGKIIFKKKESFKFDSNLSITVLISHIENMIALCFFRQTANTIKQIHVWTTLKSMNDAYIISMIYEDLQKKYEKEIFVSPLSYLFQVMSTIENPILSDHTENTIYLFFSEQMLHCANQRKNILKPKEYVSFTPINIIFEKIGILLSDKLKIFYPTLSIIHANQIISELMSSENHVNKMIDFAINTNDLTIFEDLTSSIKIGNTFIKINHIANVFDLTLNEITSKFELDHRSQKDIVICTNDAYSIFFKYLKHRKKIKDILKYDLINQMQIANQFGHLYYQNSNKCPYSIDIEFFDLHLLYLQKTYEINLSVIRKLRLINHGQDIEKLIKVPIRFQKNDSNPLKFFISTALVSIEFDVQCDHLEEDIYQLNIVFDDDCIRFYATSINQSSEHQLLHTWP